VTCDFPRPADPDARGAVSKASGEVECQVIWNDVDDLSRSEAGKHALSTAAAAAANERKER